MDLKSKPVRIDADVYERISQFSLKKGLHIKQTLKLALEEWLKANEAIEGEKITEEFRSLTEQNQSIQRKLKLLLSGKNVSPVTPESSREVTSTAQTQPSTPQVEGQQGLERYFS